jgi:8-oxo-dGTP diphosphatase/2-hydroxy-dATP diphosphatase
MKKLFTLGFIIDKGSILLGMKKRGFGQGRWNGFGGKVEQGESLENAAKREFLEESGIDVISLKEVGKIDFMFLEDGKEMEVHVFIVTEYGGTLRETEEMFPRWFEKDNIPYSDMWVDDEYWLPLLLRGEMFVGRFVFENEKTISEYELNILKNNPDD